MSRTRLLADDPPGLVAAIETLRGGGLVAIPTDTVYGIATALETPDGIERIFAAKERPPDRALMVLVDAIDQVADLVSIPPAARVLAAAFWPGGLTLVLPLRAGISLPPGLSLGAPTLGVRVPDHATPRALARAVGPLPSTSANRHGEPAATDAAEVRSALDGRVDLVLDGGPSRGGTASSVVDCSVEPPRLLRAGAIPVEALSAVLDDAELGPLAVEGVGR